ncbi:MAG: dehydrogenase E1 component subunit alpha/beta [Microscillaceae bacterium]|nr:dehydrogenase E1 component subunit alpha/beta [Microscillaceae bacterium]MDW8460854.1 dehydrogenase E1 component subunit alpha/beta [Cytophagales bacterium]
MKTKTTEMYFNRKNYTDEQLFYIYKALIKPRLIEERMLILLRQGKISKWFSGMGQEAIAVGSTLALEPTDYILPLHRNLGVFTTRGIPLDRLFAQFQGKKSGYTKGRDRSFHFGSKEHHIVGMISHLGPQLAVACGIALAEKLNRTKGVALAYTGDGGTSEGDFHEALNVASVWDLPVIFLIENNQYGLSTPTSEQYRCKHLVDKGIGYGMEAVQIDGNNVLEVYSTVLHYATEMRYHPRPVLIEAITFRMRGHEEASGTKYVPQHLFDEWALKDPIANYEKYLIDNQIISQKMALDVQEIFRKEINDAFEKAYNEDFIVPNTEEELADVYAPYHPKYIAPNFQNVAEKRMIDAISDGLRQAMIKFPNLVLMGQDIAEYGGAFKITKGFVEEFGKERVRNTPLCESAIIGAGLGLSVKGWKSVIEMQFADFVSMGFNQIVNNLAKIHWRWGQNADVVIRMPTGAGTSAGPFHSQSNEAWFFHTPGLKIVYPSTPYYAKGLLCAAIEDPNPVMYFEHKFLYRSTLENIPNEYYTLPIGKARYVTQGNEITIITYGLAVHWAKEALDELNYHEADLIDLCTLLPWDTHTVAESVKKTGKVLVCHEDTLTGGIAAEISAWIAEHLFQYLDAPIMREASLDTPVPFASTLEQNFLPKKRIKEKIQKLIAF